MVKRQKGDFDRQLACKAPVLWWIYITIDVIISSVFKHITIIGMTEKACPDWADPKEILFLEKVLQIFQIGQVLLSEKMSEL